MLLIVAIVAVVGILVMFSTVRVKTNEIGFTSDTETLVGVAKKYDIDYIIDKQGKMYNKETKEVEGSIDLNWDLFDENGELIGSMDADGNKYDLEGNPMGTATFAGE